MRLIFCADYWQPSSPDVAYAAEAEAARQAGLEYSLLDFEMLAEEGNAARAVRRIAEAESQETAILRGWMLKPPVYTQLYEALAAKGLTLINSPAAYRHCHYLPEAYPLLEGLTPRSTWLKMGAAFNFAEVMEALRPFGEKAVIVKDYVKSRKHEWLEACYIPSAADRAQVERVVGRLLQLQGEDLNEGLVFREFVEFEPLTTHSRSGMPLTREYRLFVLDGEFLLSAPYWEEGEYEPTGAAQLPLASLQATARTIQSRFFTMDIARRVDGSWNIVELGDGQVAGLPARAEALTFYRALAARRL
ncbi:MAG TPA: ATP-grasp domain-containing protein [Ktedonobacteraceae bacterium]|nr:ATP-grasp domain-containing protein [Ktedonobacteraceae bacterium]